MKLLISIVGGCGTGKTTLQRGLIKILRRCHIRNASLSIGKCREEMLKENSLIMEMKSWNLLYSSSLQDCIVIVTSTGLNPQYPEFIEEIKSGSPVLEIGLRCSPEKSLRRAKRDGGKNGKKIFGELYGVKTKRDWKHFVRSTTERGNKLKTNVSINTGIFGKWTTLLIAFFYIVGYIMWLKYSNLYDRLDGK